MDTRLIKLSKTLAHALRHEPWLYELELDDEGWVNSEDLIATLRQRSPSWHDLSESDFASVIAQSDKPRYEMQRGLIRALYGHSTPNRLEKSPAAPPEFLYHGTTQTALPLIVENGLKPMSRQYVHCSVDFPMAQAVARRKGERIVVLRVIAGEAHQDGVVFYRGNDLVWLADLIPPRYLQPLGISES
jgi:putative RNA 2'-phosphotransferase